MKKSHAWPGAGVTAAAMSSLLAACGGGEHGPQNIEIRFAAIAGEQPIACNGTVRLGSVPRGEFDLKGEKLDLDAWLGQPAKAAPAPKASSSKRRR